MQHHTHLLLLSALLLQVLIFWTNTTALSPHHHHIRIGTRPSPLAQKQAKSVAAALEQTHPSVTTELVFLKSASEHPDADHAATQAKPLAMSSVDFTSVIDNAVIHQEVDVGVHSLKDIPPDNRWCDGQLVVGCHLARVCPFDVLVSDAESLETLPPRARIGSASSRRQAQLLSVRPDLRPVNLRGNVQTRLKALEDGLVDGLIMARAGLERLGITVDSTNVNLLSSHEMLPGPAQGIVGAVCRAGDDTMLRLLREIDNADARIAATAERAFLNAVDGSAPWAGRPPVAAFMQKSDDHSWHLQGLLARPDGARLLRTERRAPPDCSEEHARYLGSKAGEEILVLAGESFFDAQ